MGNQILSSEHPFLDSLELATVLEPSQMLTASDLQQTIYRNKNATTQYFIRFLTPSPQGQSLEGHQLFLDWLVDFRNPFIVTLLYYRLSTCQLSSVSRDMARMVCHNQELLETYYFYYNFDLRQVVQRGFVNSTSRLFKESQIWYIAQALFDVVRHLKQYNVCIGGVTSQDIKLTPEGEVQFYPHKLRIDNSHAVFFEVIKDINNISHAYLPPEQLQHLRRGNYIIPDLVSTLESGDVFNIGMILLECITFECPKRYYDMARMSVRIDLLESRIRSLRDGRMVPIDLIDFVYSCLSPEPKRRMKLFQAQKIVTRNVRSHNLTFITQEVYSNPLTCRKSEQVTVDSNSSGQYRIGRR